MIVKGPTGGIPHYILDMHNWSPIMPPPLWLFLPIMVNLESKARANNSVLFSFTRKELCQFPGMIADNVTFRRSPDPRLLRVPDLRLLDLYISKTVSTRWTAMRFLLVYRLKTVSTYSWEVVDVLCLASGLWMPHQVQKHQHMGIHEEMWTVLLGNVEGQTWCLSTAHHTLRGRVARADFHVWKSSGGHHHSFGLRYRGVQTMNDPPSMLQSDGLLSWDFSSC